MAPPLTPFRPSQSNEERLVDAALLAAEAPGEVLALARPPLRQIVAFPPRFGYGTKDDRQITVAQALDIDRFYPDNRRLGSGGQGSYSGTSTPMLANPF